MREIVASAPLRARIRELGQAECQSILARNIVGRIAYALYDSVDIEPIHYVYSAGAVWGRTSAGVKTRITSRNPRVAFEVDEIEARFHWRSVVVRGQFEVLPADGTPTERAARQQALPLLRMLGRDALTEADPAPFRDIIFRIRVDTMTGREATGP